MPVARHYAAWMDEIERTITTRGGTMNTHHCLQCDRDVTADEVHEAEWMPGRVGTFHTCGDYAHAGAWNG